MLVKTQTEYYDKDSNSGPIVLFRKGDISNIKAIDIKYCCDGMKEAFDEDFIGFGTADSYGINKNCNVNLYKCIPYPEGAAFEELKIQFCPFCGEKVVIIDFEEKPLAKMVEGVLTCYCGGSIAMVQKIITYPKEVVEGACLMHVKLPHDWTDEHFEQLQCTECGAKPSNVSLET